MTNRQHPAKSSAGCSASQAVHSAPHTPATPRQPIVLRDETDLLLAAAWLRRVLAFHRADSCWVLYGPSDDYDRLIGTDVNETLRSPDDLAEAQRWAITLIDRDDELFQHEHNLTRHVGLQVTEWRPVQFGAQHGYTPLFNITQRCAVNVGDLDPATGEDCPCRSAGTAQTAH